MLYAIYYDYLITVNIIIREQAYGYLYTLPVTIKDNLRIVIVINY